MYKTVPIKVPILVTGELNVGELYEQRTATNGWSSETTPFWTACFVPLSSNSNPATARGSEVTPVYDHSGFYKPGRMRWTSVFTGKQS